MAAAPLIVDTTTNARAVYQIDPLTGLPLVISGGGGGAVTIADGADAAEGAIADAVVAAGAAGTVSAKLRRLTTDTGALLTAMQATGTSAQNVQGAQGRGVAITVNPLVTGGRGSGTAPSAVTAGQNVDLWLGLNGQGFNCLTNSVGTAFAAIGSPGVGNATQFGLYVTSQNTMFNGTNWDPSRKPNITKRVASSAASGNPDFLKASAGEVSQFWGVCGAIAAFLQIYNKASAPTIGTDTPILTYPIPANANFTQTIPNGGYYFGTGVAFAFTTDAAGTTGSAAAAITAFQLIGM